jgi:two-component system, OmpR family, response regulator VicR
MEGKILIVEDEDPLRMSLLEYFRREGFEAVAANDGESALQVCSQFNPDIIILDVQLPIMDGLEVCRTIRQNSKRRAGIIMISGSKKDMVDRVVGLEIGADDYILKPFETRELLARVRSLLRRTRVENETGEIRDWFIVDEYLKINFKQRKVEAGGKEVYLTHLEYKLLEFLARNSGVPCGRSDLVDAVWGYEAGGDINDGAVNTCISKLRKKIEPPNSVSPRYIQSVHGLGYRFVETAE